MIDYKDYAPIGCHFHFAKEGEEWEVTLFVSDTEVVGGPKDGVKLPSNIQLDIVHVMNLFDEFPAVHWQSAGVSEDDELRQHISFEGKVRGHSVWLRVLKEAPDWSGPGRLLDAASGTVEDLW